MQIEFGCGCGGRMRTSAENVGKRARCPKCGAVVVIAAESLASAEDAAPRMQLVKARPVAGGQPAVMSDIAGLSDFGCLDTRPASDPVGAATGGFNIAKPSRSGNAGLAWRAVGISALGTIAVLGLLLSVHLIAGMSRNSVASSGSSPSSGSGASSSTAKAASPSAFKRASFGPPITEAEAEDVVRRFVAAVNQRDYNRCKQLLNLDWVFEEIAKEAKFSARDRRDFLAGVQKAPPMWEQISSATAGGGEYVVLHPVRRDGEVRIVVRLSSEKIGLNYHEFIIRRNERQQAEIADVYMMSDGDTYSQSARRAVMSIIGRRDNSLASWLGAPTKEMIEANKIFKRASALAQTNPQAALEEFQKLPADIRREKTWMLFKLRLCSDIGPEAYATAFEEFRQAFPSDASIELLALDYHINRDDNASAIASAERLKAYIGGDPLLDKVISGLRSE